MSATIEFAVGATLRSRAGSGYVTSQFSKSLDFLDIFKSLCVNFNRSFETA